MSGELSWLSFLLQTSDPLFPTGAYAHSLGFEECVRLGLVRDEASLAVFLRDHLAPAMREQELPWLRFAFDAAVAGDLAELRRIDLEISAWKLPPELRDASAQIGLRRLKALRAISDAPLLRAFEILAGEGACRAHHLTVSGLQAAVKNVPLRAALAAAHYQANAGICAAALKLIRIGQDGIQRALREACARADDAIGRSLEVTRDQAGWFDPVLEIASLRHERAEERLFIS